jgi:hypothetical protein
MKTIALAFCLVVFAYGIALASESRHAAIVDMPEVATLSHASPDTWHTLPQFTQTISQHQLRHPISEPHQSLHRLVLNRGATHPAYLGTASLL